MKKKYGAVLCWMAMHEKNDDGWQAGNSEKRLIDSLG